MRSWKRVMVGSIAAATLAAIGVSGISYSANATTPSTKQMLSYSINGLAADHTITINYSSGVVSNNGGSATATSGSMNFVHFLRNLSLEVESAHNSTLTATVKEELVTNEVDITGDAVVPSGASLKVFPNSGSNNAINLPNGHFSIRIG
jgi:hypothetical protein